MRTRLAFAAILCVSGAAAEAQAPLSAIDWLSDSVASPVALPPQDIIEPPGSALAPEVTTLPLGAPLPDGVGLVSAENAGLPRGLWGASSSRELADLLRAEPVDMLPSARSLMKRVLLAELAPPYDADDSGLLVLARIDKLLSLGALDAAETLLDLSGQASPELFRRRFDVALLTGSEDKACRELRANLQIAPTYPARIFCLARGGDWHTAAVTLETANALDLLDPEEDELLARFLHPELSEEGGPLPPPSRTSPLIFRLYEAVGEPLPTGPLPLAFAHADLRASIGWKAQLEAAERLARIGAVDPNRLLGLYTERRPSASGGVWDRAAAVQTLERALDEKDADATSEALMTAWRLLDDTGLAGAFAEMLSNRLQAADLAPEAAALAFRLGLLTADFQTVAARHSPADPAERFLAAIGTGRAALTPATDPGSLAVREGFAATGAPDRYARLIAENRMGEALLRALSLFSLGAAGNLDDVTDAIALLRALGFEVTARRASLEFLILGHGA